MLNLFDSMSLAFQREVTMFMELRLQTIPQTIPVTAKPSSPVLQWMRIDCADEQLFFVFDAQSIKINEHIISLSNIAQK